MNSDFAGKHVFGISTVFWHHTCLPITRGLSLQTSSLIAQCVTLSAVSARSTSTASTFYGIFTASQPPLPPLKAFPVLCYPTQTTCEYFTAMSDGRCRCDDRSSAVTTWHWALSAWHGPERTFRFRISPSPTPSISGCHSPPSNRTEFSYLPASRRVLPLLLAGLYRFATVLWLTM